MDILTGEFDIDKIALTVTPYPKNSAATALVDDVKEDFLIISPIIHPNQQKNFFSQLVVDVVTNTTVTFTHKTLGLKKEFSVMDFVAYTELSTLDASDYRVKRNSVIDMFTNCEPAYHGMIDTFSGHDVRSVSEFLDSFSVPEDEALEAHISHMKLVLDARLAPKNIEFLFYLGVLVLKTMLSRAATRTSTDAYSLRRRYLHPTLVEHARAIFFSPRSSALCVKAMAIDSEFAHKLNARIVKFQLRLDFIVNNECFVATEPSLRDIPAIVAEVMHWDIDSAVDYAIIYIIIHNVFSFNRIDIMTKCVFYKRNLKRVRPFMMIDMKKQQIIYELK